MGCPVCLVLITPLSKLVYDHCLENFVAVDASLALLDESKILVNFLTVRSDVLHASHATSWSLWR